MMNSGTYGSILNHPKVDPSRVPKVERYALLLLAQLMEMLQSSGVARMPSWNMAGYWLQGLNFIPEINLYD